MAPEREVTFELANLHDKFLPNLSLEDEETLPREVIYLDELFACAIKKGSFTGVWYGKDGVFKIVPLVANDEGKFPILDVVTTTGIGGFVGIGYDVLEEYLDSDIRIPSGMSSSILECIPIDVFINSLMLKEPIDYEFFVNAKSVAAGALINPFVDKSGRQCRAVGEVARHYAYVKHQGKDLVHKYLVITTINKRIYRQKDLLYLACAGHTLWIIRPAGCKDKSYVNRAAIGYAKRIEYKVSYAFLHWTQTYNLYHVNFPHTGGMENRSQLKLPPSDEFANMLIVRQFLIMLRFACCKDKWGKYDVRLIRKSDGRDYLSSNVRLLSGWDFRKEFHASLLLKAMKSDIPFENIEKARKLLGEDMYTITKFRSLIM